MNLAMAVGAASIEEENRCCSTRRPGMLCRNMALRAEARVGDFKEPVVHRTVWFMAVGAIFHYRWMFPKKRAASFGVARVTIFIDAVLLQLSWVWAPVRVMAIGTGHPSFPDGHVRRT
jgi:hypothetical protein